MKYKGIARIIPTIGECKIPLCFINCKNISIITKNPAASISPITPVTKNKIDKIIMEYITIVLNCPFIQELFKSRSGIKAYTKQNKNPSITSGPDNKNSGPKRR